jgi:hypothetical protein
VVWLSRILGIYGPDFVDGRNVAITEAQVVQVAPKRVQVRVSSEDHSRLVWVDPVNLRRTDDPAVLPALKAREE